MFDLSFLQVLSWITGGGILLILILMIVDRSMAKMAFRNIFRRKVDTLLVIMGSLIGTALITGSMGMNDSFQKFLYGQVERNLGEVDILITQAHPADRELMGTEMDPVFDPASLDSFFAELNRRRLIDGSMTVLKSDYYAVRAGGGLGDIANLRAVCVVGIDFDQKGQYGVFGPQLPQTLTSDSTGIVVTENLARSLRLRVGDSVELLKDMTERLAFWIARPQFVVEAIVPSDEVMPFGFDFRSDGTIFMSKTAAASLMRVPSGHFNTLILSNRGGALEGVKLTEDVRRIFSQTLGSESWDFNPIKRQRMDSAEQGGVGILFFALSVFAIFAGTLLLSNIYLMLGEERRTELGTLRALGFSRKRVARAILFEGLFYSIISSAVGVIVGIGITRIILSRISVFIGDLGTVLPFPGAQESFSKFENVFTLVVKPESLLTGFLLGLIIPILVIVYTGGKISRMNIVAAVRGFPEMPTEKKKKMIWGLMLFIAALSIFQLIVALQTRNGALFYGSTVVLVLALPFCLPERFRRGAITAVCIGVLALSWLNPGFTVRQGDLDSIFLMLTKGFSILFAGLVLVVYNLKILESIFTRLFRRNGRFSPVMKVAIAFSSRNHRRTGLTIAMYTVVTFIITLITIIPYSEELALRESRDTFFGGFEVAAFYLSPTFTVDPQEIQTIPTVQRYSQVGFQTVRIMDSEDPASTTPTFLFVVGDDFWFSDFLNNKEGVSREGVIVSGGSLLDVRKGQTLSVQPLQSTLGFAGGGGGNPFTVSPMVRGDNQTPPVQLNVVHVIPEYRFTLFNGIFIHQDHLPEGIPESDAGTYFLTLTGTTAEEKKQQAEGLSSLLRSKGYFSLFVDDLIEVSSVMIQGIVDILRAFLFFGMIVGIVGVAILMVKALYERKRLVGMLKAIGFTKAMVFRSFFWETSFIVIVGIALGYATGILSSFELMGLVPEVTIQIRIPWAQIFGIGLVFYFFSMLATLIPSYAASRLPPADSLRYFE